MSMIWTASVGLPLAVRMSATVRLMFPKTSRKKSVARTSRPSACTLVPDKAPVMDARRSFLAACASAAVYL
jgi:hypothetical protein